MHEDEGSFVSDWNNSYGDDLSMEETAKDPVEEDTKTSPLRKKARLVHESYNESLESHS